MSYAVWKLVSFELRLGNREWGIWNGVFFALYSLSSILHFVAVANASENFTNTDPQITTAAETARLKSAQFWTDTALPGSWYRPCPIHVRHAQHSGGGATSFRFEEGEAFDWSMTIEGPRNLLLRDVIPHEVDHMVRASLVRHPIERWLDEGCATLFESAEVHQNLRTKAATVDASIVRKEWLESLNYPSNSGEIQTLYAVGFSLVEFLLSEQRAETLLKFQRDQTSIEQRLAQHYGLTVSQLRSEWDQWRRNSPPSHSQSVLRCECTGRTKPLLVILTAKWCGPCRLLWKEWNTDTTFRMSLQNRFHIHILDYDQHRALALKHGIQHLPTFQSQQVTVVGFEGKGSLLKQLLPTPFEIETRTESTVAKDEETLPHAREVEGETITPVSPSPPPPLTPSAQSTKPPEKTTGIIKDLIDTVVSIGIPAIWGGVAAGSGGTAILGWAALQLLRRRVRKRHKGGAPATPNDFPSALNPQPSAKIPFPRKLDEARQLLELRKSEGRVGLLDALRGMFLDDEIEKLQATNPEADSITKQLMNAIDRRVDDVAPLSTSSD